MLAIIDNEQHLTVRQIGGHIKRQSPAFDRRAQGSHDESVASAKRVVAVVKIGLDTVIWRGDQRPATGDVCIAVGGRAFPSPRWNDFVLVIVGALADATATVFEGNRHQTVRFMEGPHEIRIGAADITAFTADAVVIAKTPVELVSFARSILESARALVGHCHANRWSSHDLKNLEEHGRRLDRCLHGGPA